MPIPSSLALTALCLSVLAEFLVVNQTPGVGWLILTTAGWLTTRRLIRQVERRPSRWVGLLWILPFTLSLAQTVYSADLVQRLGPGSTLVTLLLCIYWSFVGRGPLESFAYALRLPRTHLLVHTVQEAGAGVAGLQLSSDPEQRGNHRRVLQGILLSLPFMMIFTFLFSSDSVFYDRLSHSLDSFSSGLLYPMLRVALGAVVLLGYLRAVLLCASPVDAPADDALQADPVVLSTSLVMLNLLFASFLAIQARYLFGGELQIALPGVTYAQYAREGFWELVTATLLVLGVAAMVYRSSARSIGGGWPLACSALLIVQTFGVAASAVKRLGMLIDAYGLTLVRLYGAVGIAFMIALLSLVLVAVAVRWSWPRLTSRMALLGLMLVSAAFLIDAEGWVTRVNLARNQVDFEYLGLLSSDALPALKRAARGSDRIKAPLARQAVCKIQERERVQGSWVSWNLSRTRGAAE